MTDQMTDERALELLRALHTTGGSAMTTNDRCSIGTALDHIASRLQAQQTDDKLADTQRAIIEAAEARGYRRGIEEAQKPDAQAVAHGYFAKGSGNLVIVEEKFSFLPHVFPLYTHPQPPSIPEPSDADVRAFVDAVNPMLHPLPPPGVIRAWLATYTARLRERLGQSPGGDGDA